MIPGRRVRTVEHSESSNAPVARSDLGKTSAAGGGGRTPHSPSGARAIPPPRPSWIVDCGLRMFMVARLASAQRIRLKPHRRSFRACGGSSRGRLRGPDCKHPSLKRERSCRRMRQAARWKRAPPLVRTRGLITFAKGMGIGYGLGGTVETLAHGPHHPSSSRNPNQSC